MVMCAHFLLVTGIFRVGHTNAKEFVKGRVRCLRFGLMFVCFFPPIVAGHLKALACPRGAPVCPPVCPSGPFGAFQHVTIELRAGPNPSAPDELELLTQQKN